MDMTMRKLLVYIAIIFSFLTAVKVSAEEEVSPYLVLENTGQKLFSRIASNQQELQKFPELMRQIVEEELMPVIDYKYAAYRILGKKLRSTSKEQREKFVDSMRHYLIRTYATALNQYKDQQVIFEPEKAINGKKIVSINTQIIDPNRPTINIAFKMRKNKKTQQWKAYDMVVEGISLLSSKQAEFSRRIATQGLDQVTIELASIAK
jgi:phospholipid transport system substrate-binding protein